MMKFLQRYLEKRFHSRGLRLMACSLFILQMVLYLAIVMYAPALALNAVTGLNRWVSVTTTGFVCIFYTTMGGIKAVIWTDVFQATVMFTGLLAVVIQGSIDAGGIGQLWTINENPGQRISLSFNPSPLERHSFWTLAIGGCFTWLSIYGVNQTQIQRITSMKSLSKARMAMWLNIPGLISLISLACMCGLVLYYQYQECDPLKSGKVMANDQLLPLYVMERFNHIPGLPGVFIASVFSGALSTLSSGLNSLAAVSLQDFARLICCKEMTEKRATVVSKVLAVIFGILCIGLTLVAEQLGALIQASLSVSGMFGGPVLGLFILAMLFPFSNYIGAYSGLGASLVCCLWLGVGAQVNKVRTTPKPTSIASCFANSTAGNVSHMLINFDSNMTQGLVTNSLSFYHLSYLYYSLFSVVILCGIGLLVSIITNYIFGTQEIADVDSSLIAFPVRKIYPGLGKNCNTTNTEKEIPEQVKDDRTKTSDLILASTNL